jgi:peroxiredoxin
MQKCVLFFLMLLLVIGASAQTQLPSVQLNTLQGGAIGSRSLLNDSVPVVLSFWSTTCGPCIEELNAFKNQWSKWQKIVSFKLVAVSTDDVRSLSKVRTVSTSRAWPFTVLLDKNQDFKRALNVNVIPQLYVVSAKGNIVYSQIGYTPGGEEKILEVLKGLQ